LIESDFAGMVGLVSVSSKFEDQRKSYDQTYSDITFVDFHFCLSPLNTICISRFTLEKELHQWTASYLIG
jgi:hypothetical protein